MSVKGLGSNAGITQAKGRPKGSSIGYSGRANEQYIINYNRNSVSVHQGKSFLRKWLGI